MSLRSQGKRVKRIVAVAAVITLGAVLVAPMAFPRLAGNTIDPVAAVTGGGRHLVVTGPIECTSGETAYLRVTVTQRETGAVAEGSTRLGCAGGRQQWEVLALAQGRETFRPGPATAVALASTDSSGETTDAHQWLVNITLVEGN